MLIQTCICQPDPPPGQKGEMFKKLPYLFQHDVGFESETVQLKKRLVTMFFFISDNLKVNLLFIRDLIQCGAICKANKCEAFAMDKNHRCYRASKLLHLVEGRTVPTIDVWASIEAMERSKIKTNCYILSKLMVKIVLKQFHLDIMTISLS